ncbi:MAG: hypothetical protein IID63_05870, partial [candidate division Zixibacteria bacterium]|nr:hypothetical protein [candidate division Zixibacteria bacterium]
MKYFKQLYRQIIDNRYVLAITTAGIVISLILHLKVTWSPLSLDPEIWAKAIENHLNRYPFYIRFPQTYMTLGINQLFGMPLKESFYILQYSLVFLLGPLFYNYLKTLGFGRNWSLVGLAALMFSFPILCAHFEPVHTWDDKWMYVFLILTFSALLKNNWLVASLFFTLGCFAREQMVLFYPIFFLEGMWCRQKLGVRKLSLVLSIPIIIYGTFTFLTYLTPHSERWSLFFYNFENTARAADSVVSLWNSFGFLWFLGVAGVFCLIPKRSDPKFRILFWGAVTALPLTLILGIFFTYVRETRILFPPFVFLMPLALIALKNLWEKLPAVKSKAFWIITACSGALLIAAGVLIAPYLWPEFDYGSSSMLRRDFAGVQIGLSLLLLVGVVAGRFRGMKNRHPSTGSG